MYLEDELTASRGPRLDEDNERNEYSTDLRKCRQLDRYQTDTAGKKREKQIISGAINF